MYLATGRALYWPACLLSIRSLRRAGCPERVVVVTDLPDDLWTGQAELGYSVLRIGEVGVGPPPADFEAWTHKMRLPRYSPFGRTLYLDCDTIVRAPLDSLWEAAGAAPLALTYDRVPQVDQLRAAYPNWGAHRDWEDTIRLCGGAAPHYNAGVFAWARHPAVDQLFDLWFAEWSRHRSTDQCALIRALHLSGLVPAVLPEEFNAQTPDTLAYDRAIIRHFNGSAKSVLLDNMFQCLLTVGSGHGTRPDVPPQ